MTITIAAEHSRLSALVDAAMDTLAEFEINHMPGMHLYKFTVFHGPFAPSDSYEFYVQPFTEKPSCHRYGVVKPDDIPALRQWAIDNKAVIAPWSSPI